MATRFFGSIASTAGVLLIALLAQFYLLRDGDRLREVALDFSPLDRAETERLLDRTRETVPAVFVGTVLVSVIQGAIMGVTFWALGVSNALLLGLLGILLCLIPVLGAPAMYVPAAGIMLATGDPKGAAIVAAVGALVVSQVDNILRPMLIGDRVSLPPARHLLRDPRRHRPRRPHRPHRRPHAPHDHPRPVRGLPNEAPPRGRPLPTPE